MTLVFPKDQATLDADVQTGAPRTHVLVIGVGRYPHLQNGGGPPAEDVPPLGQLTSPPVSAREFARWFTDGSMRNEKAPLGSVEVLLSANDQTFAPRADATPSAVEPATFANVAEAFVRWTTRCDGNPNNVGVFYFCGHGLQKVNMLILPEDFGSLRANPWSTAIDFDQTYKGMSQCRAKTQVYVIDACRQVSATMLDEATATGIALRRLFASSDKTLRTAPKLYATAEGLAAFGDSGSVSRFTSAVLDALGGGAAEKVSGAWSVSTATLRAAVRRIVETENKDLPTDRQQFVATDGEEVGTTVIHTLPAGQVPEVLVNLRCLPEEATRAGTLVIQGRNKSYTHKPRKDQWSKRIPAGVYTLFAKFPSKYATMEPISEEWIQPPVFEFGIKVKEVP